MYSGASPAAFLARTFAPAASSAAAAQPRSHSSAVVESGVPPLLSRAFTAAPMPSSPCSHARNDATGSFSTVHIKARAHELPCDMLYALLPRPHELLCDMPWHLQDDQHASLLVQARLFAASAHLDHAGVSGFGSGMQGRLASLRAGVDSLLQGEGHVPRRKAALTCLECLGSTDILWLAQIPYLDSCLLTCPDAEEMSAAPSVCRF